MKNAVYLLTLLSLFATVKLGECNVKCYKCDSKTTPNCFQPDKHKMETQECVPDKLTDMKSAVESLGFNKISSLLEIQVDRSDYTVPLSCAKLVTKVQDKEIVIRGCQLTPTDNNNNMDICKKLLAEGVDVVQHCSLCDENGCNSAPIETLSVTLIALIIPAMVLI